MKAPIRPPGIDLARLAHLDEIPCGLRSMRLINAVALATAAVLAVWAPLLITDPTLPATILRAVLCGYLLTVASNHTVLLWLTRGPAPRHQQLPTARPLAGLLIVSLIPAAIPILARRARS